MGKSESFGMTLAVVSASGEQLAWLTIIVFLLANIRLLRRLVLALIVWLPFRPFLVESNVVLRYFCRVIKRLDSTCLGTFCINVHFKKQARSAHSSK